MKVILIDVHVNNKHFVWKKAEFVVFLWKCCCASERAMEEEPEEGKRRKNKRYTHG